MLDKDWLYAIEISNQIDSKIDTCKGPFNDSKLTKLIKGIYISIYLSIVLSIVLSNSIVYLIIYVSISLYIYVSMYLTL
jgi:hypothetical protein